MGRPRNDGKPSKPDGSRQLAALSPRYQKLATGEMSVEELDWEELLRGQLKNEDGHFSGAKPSILPRQMHEAIAREILLRAESKFRENYDVAMEAILGLIRSPRTPAREKLAAAQYVIERTIGKIPDKQDVQVSVSKFQELVEGGALVIDLEDDVEDAVIVDKEEH